MAVGAAGVRAAVDGVNLHGNAQAWPGLVYTYTSEPAADTADFSTRPPGAHPHHQSVVAEWQVTDRGDADAAVDPASRRERLRIDQAQGNHNAGSLVFDADGTLLVPPSLTAAPATITAWATSTAATARIPPNVLGSILRIDPQGSDGVDGQYGVPADNPFVGDPSALDEVFAYGFRHPFRMSVDRAIGDAYVGDVGQRDLEELDVVVAGGNCGWPIKEDSFCFDQNGSGPGVCLRRRPLPRRGRRRRAHRPGRGVRPRQP